MTTALVIFNGIRFPIYLANHAIKWAKKNGASLQALFIRAKTEIKEGYIYPSDLDAAEDLEDTDDAVEDDEKIIQSQIKLLEDMAKTENIPFKSELLIDPSREDILDRTKSAAILFIDEDFDEAGILSVSSIDLEDLKKSPCPVEVIKAKK